MAGDDLFKRYLEIGASILGMSRERADSIVKDLVASGEVARGQAAKAADWLVERGRSGTEELAELIRREVRQQVAALGLATKDDVARIEARLADMDTAGAPAAPATTPVPKKVAPRKAAPRARPVADAGAAGIRRTGSVRTRAASATGTTDPAAPAAGGAVPPGG